MDISFCRLSELSDRRQSVWMIKKKHAAGIRGCLRRTLRITGYPLDIPAFSQMCPHPESIPLSAHVRGKGLIDERLQSLGLALFRDGTYDGVAYDVAAAVNHIGGGISKDVGSKLSRLTI